MNIKPKTGRRDYAKDKRKGYLMGGQIDAEGVSGGTANLPGGYMQTGGPGVYDPDHPERGAQGWSTLYQPATVPGLSSKQADAVLQLPAIDTLPVSEGELGNTRFADPNTAHWKYKV